MVTIRVLAADDADGFRALRLNGLRESPTAFGASHEDEIHLTKDDVVRRIAPTEQSWVLGAFDDDSLMVGCIGWYRDRGAKVAHKSHVWGMYVAPGYRRQGIALALVREVMARVERLSGITQIELFVAVGNPGAAGLYEGAGFERVAVHPNSLFVDGRYIDEELLVLRIPEASQVVVIADYSKEWPALFVAEHAHLAALFPGCAIEHIGSTAVPGLPAKPIIDILVGAASLTDIERRMEALGVLGYEYFPQYERDLPDRRFFARMGPKGRICHIHAVVKGSHFWTRHLAFRDELRASTELSSKYAALKRRLAAEFREDREAYSDAKAPFIESVLAGVGYGLDDGG